MHPALRVTSILEEQGRPSLTGFSHDIIRVFFFLLRIEDTDQQRSTEEATQAILDSMKWLGLDWDEGPYSQSQRLSIYKQYAEKLVAHGKAFYDTDEEGRKAIRFKMQDGVTEINDLIHGAITFDASLIEDFVILKADGFPDL